MLKTYFRHGMIVDKFHEILSFKESKWLERFIIDNTEKRNKVTIDFEKNFHKFLKISVYGKAMEKIRSSTKTNL